MRTMGPVHVSKNQASKDLLKLLESSTPTVLLMHPGDLPRNAALLEEFIVELVPQRQRSKLRARESCQRTPVQTVNGSKNKVDDDS